MKRKRPPLSSKFVVEFRSILRFGFRDLTREDIERCDELIKAIPKEEYRREDFLCSLDQAYCEHRGIKRRLTRKMFMQ